MEIEILQKALICFEAIISISFLLSLKLFKKQFTIWIALGSFLSQRKKSFE